MHESTLRVRRWRRNNRKKHRETERLWRLKNPKKVSRKYRKWYKKNRKQQLKRFQKYLVKNRKKINARIRLHKYKMTQQEYDLRLEKQKNRCAICRKKFRKTPHIDHNHKTGRNRGLLCDDCNLGLGRFKDNVKVLRRAIKYLKGLVWLNT